MSLAKGKKIFLLFLISLYPFYQNCSIGYVSDKVSDREKKEDFNSTLSNYGGIGRLPNTWILYFTPFNRLEMRKSLVDQNGSLEKTIELLKSFFRNTKNSPAEGFMYSASSAFRYDSMDEIRDRYNLLEEALFKLSDDSEVWINGVLRKRIVPLVWFGELIGKCYKKVDGMVVLSFKSNKVDSDNNYIGANYKFGAPPFCFAIDIESDARKAFYFEFKKALDFSYKTGAPGVVFDSEAYTNYNGQTLEALINHLFLNPERNSHSASYVTSFNNSDEQILLEIREFIIKRLQAMGATLAYEINERHPKALIWTTYFSQNGINTEFENVLDPNFFRSKTKISSILLYFMLSAAKKNNYKFKIIEGGEGSIWYPKYSLAYTRRVTQEQLNSMQSLLTQFPNNLELAAPMTLWKNLRYDFPLEDNFRSPDKFKAPLDYEIGYENNNNYVEKIYDEAAEAMDLDMQMESFVYLLNNYSYIWIYPAARSRNFYNEGVENPDAFSIEVRNRIIDEKINYYYNH